MTHQPLQEPGDLRLPNHHVAVLALYLLGGAASRVNAEDVAVKCFELAPQRFCWRKYSQYPSEIRARDALNDAKKVKYGRLASGESKLDWTLTPAGVSWCKDYLEASEYEDRLTGATKLTLAERRQLTELERHPQFARYQGEGDSPSPPEVADAVNLLPDAPAPAVQRRLTELSAAARAGGYEDIERYLAWLAQR